MQVNKVILLGNLTRDPEVRYAANGSKVVSWGMATNRVWRDQEGLKHEEVEFHNITAFGRQADIAAEYLRKGQLVYVEGRLSTSSFTRGDQQHYRTQIIVQQLQLGPKQGGASDERDSDEGAVARHDETSVNAADALQDDDIPF